MNEEEKAAVVTAKEEAEKLKAQKKEQKLFKKLFKKVGKKNNKGRSTCLLIIPNNQKTCEEIIRKFKAKATIY